MFLQDLHAAIRFHIMANYELGRNGIADDGKLDFYCD